MTSKLVTIKLIITVFLFCPFITYGMKRKRAEIESTSSTQNLIAPVMPSPITTLDESIQNTAAKIPKEILNAIINKTQENNNRLFICEHKDCHNNYSNNNYCNRQSLREHVLRMHAPQFKCLLCKKSIAAVRLKKAQETYCSKSKTTKHHIEPYTWTPEREKNLLIDFGIDPSSIVKPTKNQPPRIAITEKQKNLTTEIIQKILQKNNQYICIHSNCDNNYNYQDKTYLSDHIIGVHIKPYWCSLCHQTLLDYCLSQANRSLCTISFDHKHSVTIKELTFEQEEELRRDFNLEDLQNSKEFVPETSTLSDTSEDSSFLLKIDWPKIDWDTFCK